MAKAFNFRPNGSGRALLTAVKHTPVELDIPEYDFSKTVGDVLDRDIIQRDKEAVQKQEIMKTAIKVVPALPYQQAAAARDVKEVYQNLNDAFNDKRVQGSAYRLNKHYPKLINNAIERLTNNPVHTTYATNIEKFKQMSADKKTPSSNLVLGDTGYMFDPQSNKFYTKGDVETIANNPNVPADYFGSLNLPSNYEPETRDDIVKKINEWYKGAGSRRWDIESVPQVGNISGSDIQAIMSGTDKGETNKGNLENVASYLIKNGFDDNTYRKYANSLHNSPDFFKRYKDLLQEADNLINADIKSAPYKASDLRQLTPEQKNELAQRALLEVSQAKFKEDIQSILPIHKKTETGISYSVNQLPAGSGDGIGNSKVLASDLLRGPIDSLNDKQPIPASIKISELSGDRSIKTLAKYSKNPIFQVFDTKEKIAEAYLNGNLSKSALAQAFNNDSKILEALESDKKFDPNIGLGYTKDVKVSQQKNIIEQAIDSYLQNPELASNFINVTALGVSPNATQTEVLVNELNAQRHSIFNTPNLEMVVNIPGEEKEIKIKNGSKLGNVAFFGGNPQTGMPNSLTYFVQPIIDKNGNVSTTDSEGKELKIPFSTFATSVKGTGWTNLELNRKIGMSNYLWVDKSAADKGYFSDTIDTDIAEINNGDFDSFPVAEKNGVKYYVIPIRVYDGKEGISNLSSPLEKALSTTEAETASKPGVIIPTAKQLNPTKE